MPDELPTADAAQQPPKRPWWRLHASTWCLVLLTAVILAVLNIPGRFPRSWADPNRSGIAHGWPWTMMERKVPSAGADENRAEFLWSWSLETTPNTVGQEGTSLIQSPFPASRTFYPAVVAGNAAVAIALVTAVVFLAERRRRQRRSFWQVTLAESLVGCAALAAGLAWLGWQVKHTERQRSAVAAIHRDAGTVCLDVLWESRLPDWWEALKSGPSNRDVALGDVVDIHTILGSADAVLKRLEHLPAVRSLYLADRPLNDPALLAELRHLRNLQLLDVSRTGIGDEDLKHIAACETLVDLNLSHNPITGEGLKHLHRLRNLRFLDLTNVDVSIEAVDALQAALPELIITDD